CILAFVLGSTLAIGATAWAAVWAADRVAGSDAGVPRQAGPRQAGPHQAGPHRLAQAFIPAAGIGVFLGLSATTVTLLGHEGVPTGWADPARFTLLGLAVAWSLRLAWRMLAQRKAA